MLKRFLTLLLLSAAAATSLAQPAHIIIIRHAEKPADLEDKNLSDVGRRRAKALVTFFNENSEMAKLGRPDRIFATGLGKGGKGQRCQQTVAPLAENLHLEVQTRFKAEENAELAKQILGWEKHKETILICWTKERIPELMSALGVRKVPPKLQEDEYDYVFILTPGKEGTTVRTLKQNIHPKD
jgi:hypothetical protein